ncbi:DEAD-box ATP-dependent RNA helicase 39 [Phytophthora nicotianae]|uniref:Homoserine dehydrogenase n=1 Tax=Phytophthora nicotianae TaxID=4792 RepID=A0A0W8DHZ8_PHYNI|nr:DEAD-box ATP-dependent RNA helicase 39 [Phytophthora nicotianae]
MSKTLNVGLFGCGTVGAGVFDLLHSPVRRQKFAAMGVNALVSKICVQNLSKDRGLKHFSASETKFTSKYSDILEDKSINCIVELMGGVDDAKDVVFSAIKAGKHVITANKALVANFMPEIVQLLQDHPDVRFGYEAAVAGGIPIIHTLQNAYNSDTITEIAGIMNGTTNYMLSKMEAEGVAYDAVLKEAQDLGYAEANPSADVDGFDVQSKIAILAKLGFGGIVKPSDIPTVGISRVSSADFEYAKMMDSTIKLLGVAKQLKPADEKTGKPQEVTVYVSPVVVKRSNVIASISGATNLVNVRSDNLDSSAYVGRALVASHGQLGDERHHPVGTRRRPLDPFKASVPLTLQPDYEAHFYVRLTITDGLGVIRYVGQLAEESGVSIYSILQRRSSTVRTCSSSSLPRLRCCPRCARCARNSPHCPSCRRNRCTCRSCKCDRK